MSDAIWRRKCNGTVQYVYLKVLYGVHRAYSCTAELERRHPPAYTHVAGAGATTPHRRHTLGATDNARTLTTS